MLALLLVACGSGDPPAISSSRDETAAPPQPVAPPAEAPPVTAPTEPVPPSPAMPTVRASVDDRSAESCDAILRVAEDHLADLAICHAAELRTTPALWALLDARVAVGPDGLASSPERAGLVTSTPGEPIDRLEACVHASMRTWVLPLGPRGVVIYSFEFARSPDPAAEATLDGHSTGEGTIGLGTVGTTPRDARHACPSLGEPSTTGIGGS
jgi:hypothetical protein